MCDSSSLRLCFVSVAASSDLIFIRQHPSSSSSPLTFTVPSRPPSSCQLSLLPLYSLQAHKLTSWEQGWEMLELTAGVCSYYDLCTTVHSEDQGAAASGMLC